MKLKKWMLIVLASALLALPGCKDKETPTAEENAPEIPSFSITVEVAGENPVTFTNTDAEKIGSVEIEAAKKDGDVLLEADTWTGIKFNDFLDYISVDTYSVISVEAADGYVKEFAPEDITEDGTGLCWMMNGEALDAESGLVELVSHERGGKWWIKNVAKITIIK